MAIATIDDIVAGMSAAQLSNFLKTMAAAKAAGSYVSSWKAAGFPGAGSDAPAYTAGSGYTASSATNGALWYANGSVKNWLAKFAATVSQPGTLIIADRLWSCSGMGFAAATYTVTTPGSLPARITDNGVGCEIWCEQFVAAGAASGTLTVNYKDVGDAAGAGVIAAVVSAPAASQLQAVPLAAGDTGVRSIVSAVTSATWTSGSFGITIMKRLAQVSVGIVGGGVVADWAALGLPTIPADACLQLIYQANNTTACNAMGSISIIDK